MRPNPRVGLAPEPRLWVRVALWALAYFATVASAEALCGDVLEELAQGRPVS